MPGPCTRVFAVAFTVSSDGGVYSVNFETTGANGAVLQTVQRQFRRLE